MISGHAYSLLSCHEVTSQGKNWRLVKLRNPWGRGEWEGNWSDHSPLWTTDLKAQLGQTDKDDGIFFMSYEDYLASYSGTTVAIAANATKCHHSQKLIDFSS